MVKEYREADKRRIERKNAEAHLVGMYIYEALCDVAPVLNAFAKKGTKPIAYRTEPYALFEKDHNRKKQEAEEAERLRAEIYMKQMVRAGKSWGNKPN